MFGNGVTTAGRRSSDAWEMASIAGVPGKRDLLQPRKSRPRIQLAATDPRPVRAAMRLAPRPAPSPISRQSRNESPIVASSSKPTKAAAAIEIGNAAGPSPECESNLCIAHPKAPPGPAGNEGVPRWRMESASAPSARIIGSRANRGQIPESGRFNSRRNAQARSRSGIKNEASPRLCHSRSATTAPSRPRKLCGAASTAVFSDPSRGS